MTYLELSADNAFMDEYTSALFLPHTDIETFPSGRRPARTAPGQRHADRGTRTMTTTIAVAGKGGPARPRWPV